MLGSKIYLCCLAASLTIAFVLQSTGLLTGIHDSIYEARMAHSQRPASGQVVLVGIDKKSLDLVGTWPWPRSVHARAIEKLVEMQASEIAFDVDFSSVSIETEDAALATTIKKAPTSVILPTFLQASSIDPTAELVQSKPIEAFADNAWIASVNVVPDPDGLVRRYPRASNISGELVPSLSAVMSGLSEISASNFLIDYSIAPTTIPSYSFADLLNGDIPAKAIEGKFVLIGAHALELRDTLAVPVHGVISGPMLQILAAETLLQNRVLVSTNDFFNFALIVMVALLLLLVFPRIRFAYQLVCLIALAALVEVGAFYVQQLQSIVVSTAPILVFLLVSAVIHTFGELDVKSWLLRIANVEIENTKHILSRVFDDSSDGILIISEDGTFIDKNDRFVQMFGKTGEDGEPTVFENELPSKLYNDARLAIRNLTDGSNSTNSLHVEGELKLRRGDQTIYVNYAITPSKVADIAADIKSPEGPNHFATITARDRTVEVLQRQKLERHSRIDDLTGAERREEFIRKLNERGGIENKATIFAIGIQRFSTLVATMGREMGDQLLQSMFDRLSRADDRIDGIARLNGDAFAIRLAAGLDDNSILEFPYQLLQELSAPMQFNNQQLTIDLCIGRAHGGVKNKVDTRKLINQSEFALQEAAKLGPNGVCEYDPGVNARQQRARLLEQEMTPALSAGQFHVVYQPQVLAADGKPTGAEALIRWSHPKIGDVSPAEFVEIAETTGLIVKLGQMVLNQACRDAMAWGAGLTVSVNVSPVQLVRGDLVQDVRDALKSSGLPAERLVLELTESSFISDSEELITKLDHLKRLGVSMVMDDFGTGYSSLGYLSRFPIDKIKVDRSFIRGIDNNKANQAIVRSIKVLADGFGIKVLCEGVETQSERHIVQLFGCHEIQGYLFSKPKSGQDLLKFFSQSQPKTVVQSPILKVV
jgi:predicted signal transduction protein with EAL and GGDEF domain